MEPSHTSIPQNTQVSATSETPATVPARSEASGADFLWHLLDVVNPLQHIPLVSTVYRAITGDEITPAAKLAGGTLFGGGIGVAAATISIAVEGATGRDVGSHLLAMVQGEPADTPDPALAQGTQIRALGLPGVAAPVAPEEPEPEAPTATPNVASTGEPTPNPADAIAAAAAGAGNQAAWLTTALAEAEALEAANARGDASVRPSAQPWVADAMMQALAKYDTLAQQRGTDDDEAVDEQLPHEPNDP